MAEPTDPMPSDAQPSSERAKMILTELASAARAAAVAVAEEQKTRAATQVGSVAEAVRAAARSFEFSQGPAAAEYVDCAARQIDAVAKTIRGRNWAEIATEIEDMARRRPALFVAGAVALGFLAGRFWTASSRRDEPSPQTMARAAESTVAAAVASASGNGAAPGWPPLEPREVP